MSATVLTEVRERVLVVTLNRPEYRNALDSDLSQGILAALERLDNDDTIAVCVMFGNGQGFCSGMDLKAFATSGPPRGIDRLLRGPARKPIVAAIEGFALAGGLELALTADLIVAASGAKLGIPEVKVGLFAAGGALLRLPRSIPQRMAMELALIGDTVTAEQAKAWGLVNRVVEPGATLAAAIELATRIAGNAPLGVAASKQLVRAALDLSEEEFWRTQDPIFAQVSRSNDAKEGPRSFAEKREPAWTGR
jgi:enoyl-CoA hydratase